MADPGGKRGGWLGRVIVVLVVWVGLAAGAYYLLIVLSSGRAPGPAPEVPQAPGATAPAVAPSPPPAPPPPVEWTPQLIAQRPAAFVEAAIARAGELAAARERRLEEVTRRREAVSARGEQLRQSLADVQNVHDRLEQAMRRADDEGRWPMKAMGRSFDRAKAQARVRDMEAYLQSRKPDAEAYRGVLAEFARTEAALREEIESLARLRERLRLDLDRLGLDAKSIAPADLQRVDAELDRLDRAPGAAGGPDDTEDPGGETKTGESFLD